MGAVQITLNTRKDYLHWVIKRNLYLDPQGSHQTHRQVQMKLDEVYVSLRAQRDEIPGEVNRQFLETEWDELEAKIANTNLPAEEVEDLREQLLNRYKKIDSSTPDREYEIDEVVRRHDHLVILGDPGSGKTTMLRYLALKHAQALWESRSAVDNELGLPHFPILIRIADYVESGVWKEKSLSNFLADYFMHECPIVGLANLIHAELAGGNCLILLDGLDEIVRADERRDVVQRIEDFVRHYENVPNRFIITSRIVGYSSAPLGALFTCYTVQEMDKTRIRRFLERWCKAVETAQTPDLSPETRDAKAQREIEGIMRAVSASLGVHHLAANPLFLRTLALIHRTGAQLPQKRIELYKLAADTLVRIWHPSPNIPEPTILEDRNLTPLLSRLAYWLHTNKPTGIATEGEVYIVLGEEWARIKGLLWDEENLAIKSEIENFLQVVREYTGLFVERAPRRYGFMHLTFEEYYAARYLVARSKSRAKMLREHLHDPRWREPILLALGFVGLDSPEDANELLETAILAQGEGAKRLHFHSSRYEDILGLDYLFALRRLGDQFPVNSRLLWRLIERLSNELLHHAGSARFQRYQQELRDILKLLRDSNGASVLSSLLVAGLGGISHVQRHEAAKSLGLLGDNSDEVIDGLINTLNKDIPWVRCAAAKSLGLLRQTSSKVMYALLTALHNDYQSVGYQAAESLGLLGQSSDEVLGVILNALQDNDPEIRCRAVQGLRQLGQISDTLVGALLNALDDDDPDVRYQAMQSLGFLEMRNISGKTAVDVLLKGLNDKAPGVRRAAAKSLGLLGDSSDEVIDGLINTLNKDIPWARCAAAESLGLLGQASNRVVDALLTALRNDDPGVRYHSIQSLGRLRRVSSKVVETLLAVLQDNDPSVCRQATQSLGLLGQISDTVVDALLNALDDDYPRLRCAAAESLGQIRQGSSKVLKVLFIALHDEAPDVRHRAAQSLVQLGETSGIVVSVLLEALDNPKNWSIRCNSALLLGQVGQSDEPTIKALLHNLLDIDCNVRKASAQGLAQLGRHYLDTAEIIEKQLVQIIEDPKFDKLNNSSKKCSAYDCAFDSLWWLVAGGEIEARQQLALL